MFALVIITALLLDRILGEPKRFHPLVGFGVMANTLEKRFNAKPCPKYSILIGALCMSILVLPLAASLFGLNYWMHTQWSYYSLALEIIVVYWAVGLRSLHDHMLPLQAALENSDIEQAKQLVSQVVSRDSNDMNANQITSAAVETTIENGCDAVFAVLFWYAIGGVFMVVMYRLVNTLDAMWGYRNQRFEYFGKAAAKLDDFLNYIPARLTALSYGLSGNFRQAMTSWRRDAPALESPNAGVVMSAGAGALDLTLGGAAAYHGRRKSKPNFGGTQLPQANDVKRAIRLVNSSVMIWCGVLLLVSLFGHKRQLLSALI